MLRRIDDVDTASHDGDGSASAVERTLMRSAVDPAGEAADDGEAFGDELHCQAMGHPQSSFARGTRADDGEASGLVQSRRTANEEVGRRIGDFAKIRGII